MKQPVPLDTFGELMTPEDVAAALGVSRRNAYEGLRKGEIPCRRVGKRYVISREQIRTWLHGPIATPETQKRLASAN